MSGSTLDQIAEALLYEGHLLYPSRPSAVENRQRFSFGRVYPPAFSAAKKGVEPCVMQTECVVMLGAGLPSVEVSVRFLHLIAREIHALSPPPRELAGREGHTFNLVPELHFKAKLFQTSQEAFERQVTPPPLPLQDGKHACKEHRFCFSPGHTVEPIRDEDEPAVGIINRRHEALHGVVEIGAEPAGKNLFKLSVRVLNQTPLREAQIGNRGAVLMHAFVSTHIVLQARSGKFVSMTDAPAGCRDAVAGCKNSGAWPVLIGDGERADCTTMLSSPVILPDYPTIAADSAGNQFAGTEIDEMLSLRIITTTDREKGETRQADEHARRLLERTESLQRDWLKKHGRLNPSRSFDEQTFGGARRLESVAIKGSTLRAGDKVRIRPKAREDAMEMALTGKKAVVETVEQDAEGGVHLALVLEDDPGKDLGLLRQPGHRFFYRLDEVEPLREGA